MAFLSRQASILCKYGGRFPHSSSFKIKYLDVLKNKAHVCSFFIVSSDHKYSTLQNGSNKLKTVHLLNNRFTAGSIASRYSLSTDNVVDNVQDLPSGTETSPEIADSFVTRSIPDSPPDESIISSMELPITDHVETVLSTEDLALTSTDTLSVVDNVEIPLSALGLGGWTPPGLVRQFIELIHVQLDLPWWSAIVIATFIARVLLFPILVKAQQNAIKLGNVMPQLHFLQAKFNRARCSGNTIEAAKYGIEMQEFMQKHDIKPMRSALLTLMQAPVFVSFFFALRSMANLPVESLKTGGISWITDLTVPDPYYITPIVTCATLYIVIKVGAESGMKLENMKLARYFMTALPVILLPVTINFPAALLCYWCTNNFLTLGAVSLLKIESVREALNIPKRRPTNPDFVAEKKGFIKGVKEAYEDQKMLTAMAERSRMDSIRFKKAGIGPIPRTYAYDPTRPRPTIAAAARKAQAKEYKP